MHILGGDCACVDNLENTIAEFLYEFVLTACGAFNAN